MGAMPYAYAAAPSAPAPIAGDKSNAPDRFYVGVSVGYTMQAFGGMRADYARDPNAFRAPGSFQQSDFEAGRTLPLQFSVGAPINDNLRFDVSYLRYFDISMKMKSRGLLPLEPGVVSPSGGTIEYHFTGDSPDISSNAMMLNVYYNFLDRLVGRFKLRPYIGA